MKKFASIQKIEDLLLGIRAHRLERAFKGLKLEIINLDKAPTDVFSPERVKPEQAWRNFAKQISENKSSNNYPVCFEVGELDFEIKKFLTGWHGGASVLSYSSEDDRRSNKGLQALTNDLNNEFAQISKIVFGRDYKEMETVTSIDLVYGFMTTGEATATGGLTKNPDRQLMFFISLDDPGFLKDGKAMHHGVVYLSNTAVTSPFNSRRDMVCSTQIVAHQNKRTWPRLSDKNEFIYMGMRRELKHKESQPFARLLGRLGL